MSRFCPPPPTAQPGRCRWCSSRLLALGGEIEGNPRLCPSGCAANDQAPFWGLCQECDREFQTGLKSHGHVCWQCDAKEQAAMVESCRWPGVTPPRLYSREAMRERLGVVGNRDE